MSQIEVPDWAAEIALAEWDRLCGHQPDSVRMRAAITAALGAWVVPTKFQSRERFMDSDWSLWRTFDYPHDRDSDFDRMNNADGWQAEKRDLFTLRQEKPE